MPLLGSDATYIQNTSQTAAEDGREWAFNMMWSVLP